MSDLIRKEELLKRTIYNPCHAPYIVEQDVIECPTAEPKVGKWIDKTEEKGWPIAECSVCGSRQGMFWMNFCPNCGAKMERRDNEKKKITIERNICPKPDYGDEFPIPKEGWKGESDEHID